LESWDVNDLKNYLADNSVPFDEKKVTIAELKKLSKSHWEDHQSQVNTPSQTLDNSWFGGFGDFGLGGIKQKVLGGGPKTVGDKVGDKVGDAIDYSIEAVTGPYKDIKSWVFTTWSTDDIKKLLKKADIKYDEARYTTRSDLVKLAQDSYDDIAKYFNASGKYPGDWLFSTWDTKSLKKWLRDNDVDYSSLKDNRESLLHKVRQHAYDASVYTADQRESILESLDLANSALYDKLGGIRDDIFNTWSSSQLYSWLKSHKVDVDESVKQNKEELALLAQKNKHEFKNDVSSWVAKASRTVSPHLSKATKSVDNVINDTFFVGVENWSRDRLKAFLNSRGVAIPHFATKWQLVELVKANKYKPITKFNKDDFFQGWSTANVQKWLSEQGDVASSTGKDLWEKSTDLYKQFVNNVELYANKFTDGVQAAQSGASEYVDSATSAIVDKATGAKHYSDKSVKDTFFDYWSEVELRDYLKTFGIKTSKKSTKDELIHLAKTNTRWFVSGAKYDINDKLADFKLSSANLVSWVHFQINKIGNWLYYGVYGRWV
jgi:hypothetical protein